ncbi:SSU ribosomal protein S14P [Rhizobium sp. PP-F2F-G38]|uniref:Small ribosomal subunit protein uS14 n=2 Tax=Rhizobiaceae TaxID=82115 RepID=A0AA43ZEZ2_9HYPH|nr:MULTISPECIES: 30S ribosomal protein S14 [Rhizobiaceae]PYE28373.1 SSU ribosomal protein S14P [Rhizobium sp. PP-CC-3A-592]PYE36759.1 SSU ribosomal protein S14P [Rhizobium sp. PP-WC-1G-195]PYE42447.1 SSU ribosomal protein S14P [Rhizobium sp. PP-F2F-G20b]PYF00212.1 SSU ribosomal protein S14P [Rhizobium sp. PP-F2F-G38]TCL96997.1 SSU ribosomal protein S14P [Rhizobium sp. PP-WC-2G-219]TCP91124.1 SSU ribosomal protein S14P [Rhizobium sp. PP-CC-2G-626]TCQ04892.1 SSU ribosomal protein S14P [Rhizobi
MAKTSAVEKNKRRRKLVTQQASKRAELKATIMNQSLPIEERFKATLKLASLPRDGSKTRVRNRCEVTGRPRAYYRKLGMSRIALRELGNFGKIPGIVKSSW